MTRPPSVTAARPPVAPTQRLNSRHDARALISRPGSPAADSTHSHTKSTTLRWRLAMRTHMASASARSAPRSARRAGPSQARLARGAAATLVLDGAVPRVAVVVLPLLHQDVLAALLPHVEAEDALRVDVVRGHHRPHEVGHAGPARHGLQLRDVPQEVRLLGLHLVVRALREGPRVLRRGVRPQAQELTGVGLRPPRPSAEQGVVELPRGDRQHGSAGLRCAVLLRRAGDRQQGGEVVDLVATRRAASVGARRRRGGEERQAQKRGGGSARHSPSRGANDKVWDEGSMDASRGGRACWRA
eukprot:CAMPEP_0176208394 /NCGR_PEP_ID=MMETSP0121_2-20121125/13098_1 /TAXON_ID=160619 /ORGANISM="Kryptoperidinium foliaceum, Strain CCMP 1326" /LENGTH=300 /DNA_ID=CAMNT_0017547379 /DNA_START=174 /DNA_END=1074 /DNA_ORIENTATION=-